MSDLECGRVRDRLPERAAGRLDVSEAHALERHLEGCAACRAHAVTVRTLRRHRPEPPAGLEERVTAALDAELGAAGSGGSDRGREGRRRWLFWAAPAAAAAVGLLLWSPGGPAPEAEAPGADEPAVAGAAVGGTLWPTDDGTVAGAPVLDDLSDEAILTLLEEMEG